MALKDKIRTMGFMPDVGKLTDEFNAKFGELRDRLDTIIERLDTLIAETRTQRGGPVG
jgi:tetrahydromethanopterin S-methyltransferase subunit G